MNKSILFTTVCLFFFNFFCSAQNSIIVGPQNDCSLINKNIATTKSKFNVEGVSKIRIETYQHRKYDKSRIYDEYGNIIWEWKGESYNDTWYKKEHVLDINSRFIEIEFYQGYRAPFCNGYIKISKIVNGIVPSSYNTPQKASNQSVENSVSNQNNSKKAELNLGAIEFQVISRTYEVGNLQVAQHDFTKYMDWETANATCAKLGGGWRLPTKEELNTLLQDARRIGLIYHYWSSTEANNDEAWGDSYELDKDKQESGRPFPKKYNKKVRVVRDLTYKQISLDIRNSEIVGNPIEIGDLLVAQYDYPQNLDWDNANKACQSLGDGWRLPTKDELNTLYKNKTKIGGFFDWGYWSSTEYTSNHACFQHFGHGTQYDRNGYGFKTQNILYVRPVRTKVKTELIVGKPINSNSEGQKQINQLSSSKLIDLERDGKSVSSIISEKMNRALENAASESLVSEMSGKKFDLNTYVKNAAKQIKEEEELALNWKMTPKQIEEFNYIIDVSVRFHTAKLKMMKSVINYSNAILSDSRTEMMYGLDNNPYGDSFQCDRCGNLSRSKKKPRDLGCYNDRSHRWQYADTKGGYRCYKCGVSTYIINEDGHKKPSGAEFGSCRGGSSHYWERL
jgi:hypothetical protein